jgi:RES domain-containing protein
LETYTVAEMSFDSRLVQMEIVDPATLPPKWQGDPAPRQLRVIGNQWIAAGSSAVLRVPSAIIYSEFNYLINPGHGDWSKITIGASRPFRFDPRLAT